MLTIREKVGVLEVEDDGYNQREKVGIVVVCREVLLMSCIIIHLMKREKCSQMAQ